MIAADASGQSSASRAAIRAELAGLLLQSRRYDDAAREYSALVAMNPRNRTYRLQLARALAWGERWREAEHELVFLARQRPGDPTVESLLLSVRSGMDPTSSEAARWVSERNGSPAYRQILARAYTRERRLDEALAQYDTLLRVRQSADLFLERAYAHLARRDLVAAERDGHSSLGVARSSDAYILLGDVHRWRGDLAQARNWYVRARVVEPTAPKVAAAFARLARDERPVLAFIPDASDPLGWTTINTAASDNIGAQFVTTELRRGLPRVRGFDASIGVKALHLNDRAFAGSANGFGGDLALSRETARGRFWARARARGGFTHHPAADLVPEATFSLAAFMNAWGVGAEISAGPAYPSLVTLASLLPLPDDGGQLREESVALSVGGPLAKTDVAARHQSTSLSDGNSRTTVQGTVRFPARAPVALLYSGNSLSYAQHSDLYWSPERYMAHSLGVEYARRRLQGMSIAARLLPGLASSVELDTTGASVSRNAIQLGGGLEAVYRARGWEVGAGVSYGLGRAGEYERFDAILTARFTP